MLAVYDSKLYKDTEPWVEIVLSDISDGSVHEVILAGDYVAMENSSKNLTNYAMYDIVTGVSWELFVQDDRLGMVAIETDDINVGDGNGQSYIKLGKVFPIHILNSSSTGEEDLLSFRIVSENTWEEVNSTFSDITEVQGGYETSTSINQLGNFVVITNVKGYGNISNNITIIDKTIIDLNTRLELLTKELRSINSKGWI